MGRGPTRCYDRRCRYAPHIACSRGCRCPSHLVAHLRCHLHRLQAVTRYASSSSSNSTDAHHPTHKNLMKDFFFLISFMKLTSPPQPRWPPNVGTRGGGGGPTFAPEVQRPGGKRGRRTSHLPTLTLPRYLGKVLPCLYIRPLLQVRKMPLTPFRTTISPAAGAIDYFERLLLHSLGCHQLH